MLFELLLIATVLASLVVLAVAAITAMRGRGRRAGTLILGLAAYLLLYLVALLTVSLASPQRVLAIGEDWCFDDWCVTVDGFERTPVLGPPEHPVTARGVYCVVRLHLSNHARGREQRASSAGLFLLDAQGRRHEPSPEGVAALEAVEGPASLLTTTVALGQSVRTVCVFDLPTDASDVGLTVVHPLGFAPGLFVIGDQASLGHRRTVVRLF